MTLEIRSGVRRLFRLGLRRREAVREAMDEELQFHLDCRIDQLMREGMTLEAARAEALHRLGGGLSETQARLYASAERRERRAAIRERIADLVHDLRYAARSLARRPGFAAIAVITLAVGIGANTAIFSAVYALLIRPLPFHQPERLMDITLRAPAEAAGSSNRQAPWSYPKFAFYREAQRSFSDVALHSDDRFNLSGGEAERVNGTWVSARYLTTLGVAPALGQDFPTDLEAHGAAARLVIISDGLWKRRLGASPKAIGSVMIIDGKPFEMIGVLPAGFAGMSGEADLLVPVTTRDPEDLSQAWSLEFSLIGRLKPGLTPEQAASETQLLGDRVYQAYPPEKGAMGNGATAGWSAGAELLDHTRVAPAVRKSLLILSGSAGFVLLITCVNLANLLLGRASERRREIAVRLAIGAGRGRLMRLLIVESLLLSLMGGAASVIVAWAGTEILSRVNPAATLQAQGLAGLGVVGFSSIHLNAAALLFTLTVAVTVGLVFGLVPALDATRTALSESLKDDGAGTGGPGRFRIGIGRHSLVVIEVALALILLAGAGLTIRSLSNLMGVEPGFDAGNLLTFRLAVPPDRIPRDSIPGFTDNLLGKLAALPGVADAALADCPPLAGGCNRTIITFPDRPPVAPNDAPAIGVHTVTPGWFRTLGVPLRRGRLPTDADRLGTPKVIVVSESAARAHWPKQDPIGQRAAIWQGGFGDGATVVGVVGDVRFGTIDSAPKPDVYMSYQQAPRSYMMVFIRTHRDPVALAPAVRRTVHEFAPDYPVYDLRTMESRVAAASAQARFSAVLLTLFALVALASAVIGIYGVMSFAVLRRTREIGIRMALGADRQRVLGMVVRDGILLTAVGGAIGLAAALVLTRVLCAFLFEVTPSDPGTYLIILFLLVSAALLASWIPARRAALVDPVEALRRG
jgi:putative ABC transport system permease protein